MISPSVHYETVTVKVYSIPAPATWKDVSDTLHQIRNDPDLVKGDYDDAVMVHCADEVLRFIFEIVAFESLVEPNVESRHDL